MSEDFASQISDEVRRIQNLELADQPEAYSQLRELLEKALDSLNQSDN